MRTIDELHGYQQKMINFQCTHPMSMIWADVGLGKTAVTLTSIAHLVKTGFLRAVVVVAPIRVCRLVWRQESAKWSHLSDLTFSMVMGTKDQRVRALLRPANIYVKEEGEPPYPQYGVIVFYEDEDAARTACANACKAHWGDDP